MLNKIQREILRFLQADLPLKSSPYAALARRLDVNERRIVKEIRALKKAGYIRRLGGLLNHHKIGLKQNCMCVWRAAPAAVNRIAKIAVKQPQISHCYLRKTDKNWPYNFYTMIHGRSKTECAEVVKRISGKSGVEEYKMLFTQKQFKKKSPKYEI